MNEEQWHEGPNLTVSVGMTDEERRATALMAAASAWAGISAITDRDTRILATAERFERWLAEGGRCNDAVP